MEANKDIKTRVENTLEVAKQIKQVEAPALFTENTVNKLKAGPEERFNFSYSALLKIAAIVVLLIINAYTIQYILGSNQTNTVANNSATVKDLVNDYQPSESSDLTFDENLNK